MKMKHIALTTLSAFLFAVIVSAQEKRLESNVMMGGGLFLESGYPGHEENPGAVLRLSYGLDRKVSEKWSVMPGFGSRIQLGDIRHLGWVGGDPDEMVMLDAFVSARYHFTDADGTKTVIGLGPALSYSIAPDTYYIDADPSDPRNAKEKFHRFSLGIQPSVTFRTDRHFQWGLEASIGLLNELRQYPEYHVAGSIHFHYLAVMCGWRF